MKNVDGKISKDILKGVEGATFMIQARYPVAVAEQLKHYCQTEGRVQYKVLVEALAEYLKARGYDPGIETASLKQKRG